MTFGIFISAVAVAYLVGVFVALKAFDRTPGPVTGPAQATDLPETQLSKSQRDAARAEAGMFWPIRLAVRVAAVASGNVTIPNRHGMDIHPDLHL